MKFIEFLKRFFRELRKPFVPSREYRIGQRAGLLRNRRYR